MSDSSRCLHHVCEQISRCDIVTIDIAIAIAIVIAVTIAIPFDSAITTTLAIDMVHCVA